MIDMSSILAMDTVHADGGQMGKGAAKAASGVGVGFLC
jgi:hypothetical protein